jgi:hypothetical protein
MDISFKRGSASRASRPGLHDLPQHGDIDFGVMRGHVRRAVPQNGANHVECSATPQHGCRSGMPEQTGALRWGCDRGLANGTANDVADDIVAGYRAHGRVQHEEDAVTCDAGPRALEMREQRVTASWGSGNLVSLRPLPRTTMLAWCQSRSPRRNETMSPALSQDEQ